MIYVKLPSILGLVAPGFGFALALALWLFAGFAGVCLAFFSFTSELFGAFLLPLEVARSIMALPMRGSQPNETNA